MTQSQTPKLASISLLGYLKTLFMPKKKFSKQEEAEMAAHSAVWLGKRKPTLEKSVHQYSY